MSDLPPPPPPPRNTPTRQPFKGLKPRGSGGPGQNQQDGNSRTPLPRWAVWAIIATVLALGIGSQMFATDTGERLSYTEFLQQVRAGKVEKITLNNATNTISGTLTDGSKFTTTGAVQLSDADEQLLKERGVDYDYRTPQANWFTSLVPILLPFIFVIAFFMWMQRRAMGQQGNIMSIGRSKAKAYQADKPSTTFADVAGYDGVKLEIKEVVDFLRMPERFKEIGARVPKGILLVGPPGTGKTLFARAVAGEAGVGFLSVTGSDFMEMFVGVGASRVRDLFQQARKMGKAIIFVDEIDSIGRKRGAGLGGGHDEREPTLNQMLKRAWAEVRHFWFWTRRFIIFGVVAVWLMNHLPIGVEPASAASLSGWLGTTLQPFLAPIGINAHLTVALVFGFVAKEIVLGGLAVIYAQSDANALGHALRQEISNAQAYSFMLFTLLYTPCLSTVAVIRSESRSRRFAALSVLWSLLLAWIVSFVFYQGARFFGWA